MLVARLPIVGEAFLAIPPGHHGKAVDLAPLRPSTRQAFQTGNVSWLLGKARAQDACGWGQPVLAPIAGEVVTAADGAEDRTPLCPPRDLLDVFVVRPLRERQSPMALAGNYVVIASVAGCTLLAHLRKGSLRVCTGMHIHAGEVLGEIGNSGSALIPHVHWQLMDDVDPLKARVLPIQVPHEYFSNGRWLRATGASVLGARRLARVRPIE